MRLVVTVLEEGRYRTWPFSHKVPLDSVAINCDFVCNDCKLFVCLLKKILFLLSLSRVRLFATPWTVAYQDPPSMGFSRQEYWSGLPFPSPGDLPDPGIEPWSPAF